MSTTTSQTLDAAHPKVKRRGLKWLLIGLGCLAIGGIVYSQPIGREGYLRLLRLIGPQAVPILLSSFEDSNHGVQKTALEMLTSLGPTAVPNLLRELDSASPTTRENVAIMLSQPSIHAGRETQISSAIERLLDDNNRQVKLATIQAQASLGGGASAALPRLIALLDDKDAGIRGPALKALVAIDRDSTDTLAIVLKMLKDSEPKVRKDACSLLETIGAQEPRVVTALIEILHDSVAEVRGCAADYLGEIGPVGKVAIPALEELAEHEPYPEVRDQAAQSAMILKEFSQP